MASAGLPAPDDLMHLPTAEVAMLVLQHLDPNGTSSSEGFIGRRRDDLWTMSGQQPRPTVNWRVWAQKISEAFDWLYVEGLLAHSFDNGSRSYVVTAVGRETLDRGDDGARYLDAQRLLPGELHPSIDARARRQFLLGETECAVMVAMKEVEIRMREAGALANDLVGVNLATAAFKPGVGPLHDGRTEGGEQEAAMALFRGAMGVFRNPVAHRRVDYDDPREAVEVILFADLLLRMIDRAAAARA